MNTRLEQDAHDTLQAFEIRQQFVALEKARWALAKPKPYSGSCWAPTMTAQEKQQHDQYVIDNKLPF